LISFGPPVTIKGLTENKERKFKESVKLAYLGRGSKKSRGERRKEKGERRDDLWDRWFFKTANCQLPTANFYCNLAPAMIPARRTA
jgi:hypothetical protein